jgi:hypothetical protein
MCAYMKNPQEAWFNFWLVNSEEEEDKSHACGKWGSDFNFISKLASKGFTTLQHHSPIIFPMPHSLL